MVIDSSAVLAILLGEPEAELFARLIGAAERRLLSAFSALESAIVVHARKGDAGARELDVLLHQAQIETVPLTQEQGEIAREAWVRYGKGRHAAGLNIGGCCAYALARIAGEPLLFKGDDFGHTDIPSAARA